MTEPCVLRTYREAFIAWARAARVVAVDLDQLTPSGDFVDWRTQDLYRAFRAGFARGAASATRSRITRDTDPSARGPAS